jgi:hypothetical protein
MKTVLCLALICAVGLPACEIIPGTFGPDTPASAADAIADPPRFEGRLRDIVRPGSMSGQLLLEDVKWPPESLCPVYCPPELAPREARVLFGKNNHPGSVETLLFLRRGGNLVPASGSDLQEGQWLEVWTTEAELRSDPPQYFARQLVISAP